MRNFLALGLVAALAVTTGCGGSSSSVSPTTPTVVNTPTSPTGPTSGAMLTGTVTVASSSRIITPRDASGLTVSVAGTNLSAPVDGNGNFALDGVPSGDLQIKITGGNVDVTLTVGGVQAGQTIRLRITVSGSSGTIDSDSREGSSTDADKRELEGRIETIVSASSLVVSGQLVTTSATTVIRKGGTTLPFADLLVGMRVHVKGTLNATTAPASLAATEILVQNENTDVPMKVEGVVAAEPPVGGSCPAITFVLRDKAVTVTATDRTNFKPGCFDVKAGAVVEVQGRLQGPVTSADTEPTPASGSTLLADKVDVKTPAPDDGSSGSNEVEFRGAISGMSGSCPAVSFLVGEGNPPIVTSASTSFKPSCNALKNGDVVEVKAMLSGGQMLATKVTRE